MGHMDRSVMNPFPTVWIESQILTFTPAGHFPTNSSRILDSFTIRYVESIVTQH